MSKMYERSSGSVKINPVILDYCQFISTIL
jgi:hypothetical protein